MGAGELRTIAVIIPSRPQPLQEAFLTRAVGGIRAQTALTSLRARVLVGIDRGQTLPVAIAERLGIEAVQSEGQSQALACNAAAREIGDAELVAFLEDDDEWLPHYLEQALEALEHAPFVSSTQLEVDAGGLVIRINDFATPSGWLMDRRVWETVGPFDPQFRYHLDNDWLGRLADRGFDRVHLVEATAPVDPSVAAQVRPWLANVVALGGGRVQLLRHAHATPLVRRLVHPGSGMARIAADPRTGGRSESETQELLRRYGRIPW
jgi:hypothetical protein